MEITIFKLVFEQGLMWYTMGKGIVCDPVLF